MNITLSIKRFLQSQKARVVLGLIGLYLLVVGVSWAAFSYLKTGPKEIISPTGISEKRAAIDLSAPKTEACPLTGEKFTSAERDIWSKRRPLTVMIENHEESRPQSGLSNADIVYEAIAEGGITRFLAIFYCGTSAAEVQIGPVRSARTYYLDWASEYGDFPLYAHVGGANKPGLTDALGQIRKYGWDSYNDLNQFSIGFPTFWRDYERLGHPVATEHTMYSTTDKLWEVAEERELGAKNKDGKSWDENFVPWNFSDGKSATSPTATRITFPFWEGMGAYEVAWNYDSGVNVYKRDNGGNPQQDLNNNEQLQATNVVVIFTRARGPVNELKHMLYDTTGSGKALIFQNGEVIEATWSKASRTARTKFMSGGREVSFVRGPIWIEVLDTQTKVEY
ncbi:MAG: DUF3048 domain-containing protein [Candidatus Blackburnbacteria bacterium]|nr:DUF3048 domain-containing protein [Candidatus Blackburnbacteria bacterium]